MAKLAETHPCVPLTERGRGILIAGDAKTNCIIYCNGRSVIIRSLENPLEAFVYGEHAYPATVARFSPNGEWVASGDASGTVRIWGRSSEHALKYEFRALSGRIDDLEWSPDGQRIVVSGDGKGRSLVRAFMWDSGTNVGDFDGHSRRVLSCSFKPTRPFRIATCGEDFLVNFYEGPPFRFKTSHREHSNFVNCVRFSPDGSKFITVGSDRKGVIFDGKTGEKIGELSTEDGHKGSIYAASWSPGYRTVQYHVRRISLLGDQNKDAEPIDVGAHPKDLDVAVGSPELAFVSTDAGVIIIRGSKIVSTTDVGYAVTAAAISPDGTEAVVGGQDGKLHVYSIKGDTLTEEKVLDRHRGPINVIRFSPDGSMFASGDLNREAVVWDRITREVKLKNMLYHTARINCIAWSPDSSKVATGSLDTCILVYEIEKPVSSRITLKGAHLGGVYGLAFIDQNTVISAGEDACVRVWSLP